MAQEIPRDVFHRVTLTFAAGAESGLPSWAFRRGKTRKKSEPMFYVTRILPANQEISNVNGSIT